jgi:FkbM family methyltransferase
MSDPLSQQYIAADDVQAALLLKYVRALYLNKRLPEWLYKIFLKLVPSRWFPHSQDYVLDAEIDNRRIRLLHCTSDTIGREAWLFGYYDRLVLSFIRDLMEQLKHAQKTRMAFYDIGANIGNHTIFLADLFDHVYCFEPNPKALEILKTNVGSLDQVQIFPIGLSNEDAELSFATGSATNLGNAHIVTAEEMTEPRAKISVRNGDQLIRKEDLLPPMLMKIDVEGHEPEVIAGLQTTIERHTPVIVMEILARALGKVSPMAELLSARGYRVFKMSGLGHMQQLMRFQNELVLSPFDFDGPCDNAIAIAPAQWEAVQGLCERCGAGRTG